MTDINNILTYLESVANNPEKSVAEYLDRTGSKAIGMFPVYTPGEMVHALDMLPVGIWGANGVELDLAKQYFPAFCCSIMFTCMELALKGTYKQLSAVIIPGMCDTLNCIGQNWKSAMKDIPYISMVHPQSRKMEAGVQYLVSEYQYVQKKLEEIAGKKLTEEALAHSIDVFNENRAALRRFDELASKHPNTINNYYRNRVIKAGYFMEKEAHTAKVNELNDLLQVLPEEKYDGKRVVVSGIIFDSKDILDVLESNKLRIVGDNVAHETRQFRTDVPKEGATGLERLARQWSNIEGCSLAFDPKKLRGKMVADLAKERGADGVIYALMKFCDPEEYDQPIFTDDIREAGIPMISVEVDQQATSAEQIRTRIQTFAELL